MIVRNRQTNFFCNPFLRTEKKLNSTLSLFKTFRCTVDPLWLWLLHSEIHDSEIREQHVQYSFIASFNRPLPMSVTAWRCRGKWPHKSDEQLRFAWGNVRFGMEFDIIGIFLSFSLLSWEWCFWGLQQNRGFVFVVALDGYFVCCVCFKE